MSLALLNLLQHVSNHGRQDTIAIYTPPREGERRGRYTPRQSPLLREDLLKHVDGRVPLGIYVLDKDLGQKGLTKLAIIDLDDKKKDLSWGALCREATNVTQALITRGLIAWPLRSGSGHGIHLWLFWNEPVSAATVRQTLRAAVKEAEVTCHVDIFPAQDRLDEPNEQAPDPLGNLIALPFSRESRPISHLAAASVIEDLTTWAPTTPAASPSAWPSEQSIEEKKARPKGDFGPVDPEVIASALTKIPNEEYQAWVQVGMALRSAELSNQLPEGAGLKLWDDWSKSNEKYNERELPLKWRSFRKEDKITLGTLWKLAEDNGWRPPRNQRKQMVRSGESILEIDLLNQDHFICEEGGKAFIFRQAWDSALKRNKLVRMNAGDFKLLHKHEKVTVGHSKRGIPMVEDLGSAWLDSPQRRQYQAIVLKPEGCDETEYNLWRGWSVTPSEHGSCSLFKDHLLNNLCNGDQQIFEYLWAWCAYTIQRPHEPIGVAVVLRGGQGTGKGTFARAIGELFGQHYLQVFSTKDLTGRFNAHLRDCIWLYADEAVWAGSKQEKSTLKGIITEPYLTIEGKGQDLFQTRNMLHLIISTNEEWSVPAGMDERRYLALNIGDRNKQDRKYFRLLWEQLNSGGNARLLQELLTLDISAFDPSDVPQTQELGHQKLMSLEDSLLDWWIGKLHNGQAIKGISWNEPVPIQAVYADYVSYHRMSGKRNAHSINGFSRRLKDLTPSPLESRVAYLKGNLTTALGEILYRRSSNRCWVFPGLENSRAFVENMLRMKIQWAIPLMPDDHSPPEDDKPLF